MKNKVIITGISEKEVFECNVCKKIVKSCDSCGIKFVENDAILHVPYNYTVYHFCSNSCYDRFFEIGAYKLVVPA